MDKVRINELNDAVREFLTEVFNGGGLIIEDESGRDVGGVMPYRDPTTEQRQQAAESLERLQRQAETSMKEHGVTEDDVMRVILEDD